MESEIEKNVFKKDFTVSFALLLRTEETLDLWDLVWEDNWRQLFRGGA